MSTIAPSLALRAAHDIVTGHEELRLEPRDVALLILLKEDLDKRSSGAGVATVDDLRALSAKLDALEGSHPGAVERRVTEAIGRLLKADSLVRADMHRLRDAEHAEYQFTPIGEAIADWKVAQTKLDGEPLTAILTAFNVQLAAIQGACRAASNGDSWKRDVVLPMQHVVRELLTSVQRHQRALDRAHKDIRHQIPELLRQSSEDAINGSRLIVDHVMKTIGDLFSVTFEVSNAGFGLLDAIQERSEQVEEMTVTRACEDARMRLESILDWTTSRQGDWGRHFDAVHRHLRFAAMVDRSRKITEALKRAVAQPPTWTLEVADAPRFVMLRENLRPPNDKPALRRPRSDYVDKVEVVGADELPELLERLAREHLSAGVCRWTELLLEASRHAPADKVMLRLPEIMRDLVRAGTVTPERSLVQISAGCEIEQLEVRR